MPSKKPLRSQEQVPIRFDRPVAERLRKNAKDLGMSVSEYLSVLVMGQTPVARPASENTVLSLAAVRISDTIILLKKDGDRDKILRLLCDTQHRIVEEQEKVLVPAYDAAIVAQGKNESWGDLE
jgi:hypothetical protein